MARKYLFAIYVASVDGNKIKETTENNIKPRNWRDDYDDDGNYIGEESSTDTEEANNEE